MFEIVEDPGDGQAQVDAPIDLRPDLSVLGIEEVDKGVCQDNYINRGILRRAGMSWDPVYSTTGQVTGLIFARSKESRMERRLQSLAEKRPLLTVPTDNNSDFITGLDLLAEEATDYLVPPWVVHSTRLYLKEQEDGHTNPKRQPLAQPHRCRQIKDDGIRCMLWSSGRIKDDGLCRIHLRSTQHKTSDDIERARAKLVQAAPYAVDMLEDLMENAESEPVKLKAATEILDRAGVRGGIEIDTTVVLDARPAASVIAERLDRIAQGAISTAARLAEAGLHVEPDKDIIDAEVVQDDESATEGPTSNEPLEDDIAATATATKEDGQDNNA
jgi:hypothetical protein